MIVFYLVYPPTGDHAPIEIITETEFQTRPHDPEHFYARTPLHEERGETEENLRWRIGVENQWRAYVGEHEAKGLPYSTFRVWVVQNDIPNDFPEWMLALSTQS